MKKFFVLLMLMLVGLVPVTAQQTTVTPQDLADPDGQFIDVNGAEIYYIERGNPEGPVVLLLHGFGGSTFTWRDNMDAIVEAGFRVIAFDRPPYGLSDKSPDLDYTVQGYSQLTAGVMDALEVESAVLVGHSAGGGVIAQFAIDFPERVDALVFVAGFVGGRGPAPTEEATPEPEGGSGLDGLFQVVAGLDPNSPLAQGAIRTILTPERFVEILSGAYYDPSIVTEEVAAGYQRPLRLPGWEAGLLAVFSSDSPTVDDAQFSQVVETQQIPILLIWGEEDTWVPLEAGLFLQEQVPSSQLITYPLVGHLPMEENIDQFNADLAAFLQALTPR
ncbi:MAG: alpha/beta hydrolase [bacterium]|nr:alpha/beta hydrolase [bacterium]